MDIAPQIDLDIARRGVCWRELRQSVLLKLLSPRVFGRCPTLNRVVPTLWFTVRILGVFRVSRVSDRNPLILTNLLV